MGMAFFGPALVLLTIFLFLPMILTLIFSFTDFFALNPGLTHFVGLDNYIQIFKDDVFSQAFFNTVKFVIIIVPLQGIGALVLALLINKVTHCKKYFKVAFFVPVVMSLAVVSTLWIQIYSPEGSSSWEESRQSIRHFMKRPRWTMQHRGRNSRTLPCRN